MVSPPDSVLLNCTPNLATSLSEMEEVQPGEGWATRREEWTTGWLVVKPHGSTPPPAWGPVLPE